jgi:hypothetical protein
MTPAAPSSQRPHLRLLLPYPSYHPLQGSSSPTTQSSRSATPQPFPVSTALNALPIFNPPIAGFPGPSQPRAQASAESSNSMHNSSAVATQSTFRPAVASAQTQNVPQAVVQAPFQQRNPLTAPHPSHNPGGQPIRPQAAPPHSFSNATYATMPTSSSFPSMTSDVRSRIITSDRRVERTTRQELMTPDRLFGSELEGDLTK